jgi:hypothetical protein
MQISHLLDESYNLCQTSHTSQTSATTTMREIHAILSTIAISSILHALNDALILPNVPANAALPFLLMGRCIIAVVSIAAHKRLTNDETGVDPSFTVFISVVVPIAVHQFWV